MFKFARIVTLLLSLPLIASLSHGMPMKDNIDVDMFLRTIKLPALVQSDQSLNLIAQTERADISTTNVNELNDFVVVAVSKTLLHPTKMVEFDKNLKIKRLAQYKYPPLGPDYLYQKDIPSVTLQDGLTNLRYCMARKGKSLPKEITSVTIYKSIYSLSNVVYMYTFKDPKLSDNRCWQILYIPKQEKRREGCEDPEMIVSCHFDVDNVLGKM